MLIVGRIVNGLSVGICSAQVPVYISEISPPSKRGRLIGMQQWAITWGIGIMFFICYGCSFINGQAAFRLPWGLQIIPALLLCVGLCVLPESPRWLAKNDRWEEARDVLVLIHGKGDPNAPLVTSESAEIQKVVRLDRQNADFSWFELIQPGMINRTHIGVFTMAGLGGDLLPSGIQFIINVVMTVPALIWQDRWGRRPTMLMGALLMCLFMSLNAGLFAVYSRPATTEDHFSTGAISMVVRGPPAKAISKQPRPSFPLSLPACGVQEPS